MRHTRSEQCRALDVSNSRLRNLEVYQGHTEFMMAKEQLRQDLFRLGQRPQPLKGDAIRCRQCDFDRTTFFALMPFFWPLQTTGRPSSTFPAPRPRTRPTPMASSPTPPSTPTTRPQATTSRWPPSHPHRTYPNKNSERSGLVLLCLDDTFSRPAAGTDEISTRQQVPMMPHFIPPLP